jgi:hypothetical protein
MGWAGLARQRESGSVTRTGQLSRTRGDWLRRSLIRALLVPNGLRKKLSDENISDRLRRSGVRRARLTRTRHVLWSGGDRDVEYTF